MNNMPRKKKLHQVRLPKMEVYEEKSSYVALAYEDNEEDHESRWFEMTHRAHPHFEDDGTTWYD